MHESKSLQPKAKTAMWEKLPHGGRVYYYICDFVVYLICSMRCFFTMKTRFANGKRNSSFIESV